MLNAEKFKDEIYYISCQQECFAVEKETENIFACSPLLNSDCQKCIFSGSDGICVIEKTKWLLSEYKEKIELTQDEYDFLYLLGNGYLARDLADNLVYYKDKPKKFNGDDKWSGYGFFNVERFERLADSFKFIKSDDKEPYSVKNMLDNYMVKK